MAIFDLTVGGGSAHSIGRKVHPTRTRKLVVDASALTYAAASVLNLFKVPADSLVTIVPDVQTAEGGVATADLGWSEDPNGFADALDLNVATTLAAPAAPVTKFLTGDTIVTLTLDHELDAAVLAFYVQIVSL